MSTVNTQLCVEGPGRDGRVLKMPAQSSCPAVSGGVAQQGANSGNRCMLSHFCDSQFCMA